jgi:hypothetical protein
MPLADVVIKLSAARQPTGYVGRLQQRALFWKVGRQIPRNGIEDTRSTEPGSAVPCAT